MPETMMIEVKREDFVKSVIRQNEGRHHDRRKWHMSMSYPSTRNLYGYQQFPMESMI